MKHHILLVTAALTILILSSCKKEVTNKVPVTGDYLPMQVGNYWEIQDFTKYNITGTKIIDFKTYYIFVQQNDTSYYRNDNNKIYVRRSNTNESVKFDLTANTGETWEFKDGGTSWNVTLTSKTDTITINNTKIPNCYNFFLDLPQAVDDEHAIWLAPGIGFINMTCGFCAYPSLKLQKARINNTEITFP
jgi:hypothetical protein